MNCFGFEIFANQATFLVLRGNTRNWIWFDILLLYAPTSDANLFMITMKDKFTLVNDKGVNNNLENSNQAITYGQN